MADIPPFIDPNLKAPSDAIGPDARIVEGVAHNGRPCRIVDNTNSVDFAELHAVLRTLIADRKFGRGGLSAAGGSTIALDRPISSHIQFGEQLYRILLFAYEARIERF